MARQKYAEPIMRELTKELYKYYYTRIPPSETMERVQKHLHPYPPLNLNYVASYFNRFKSLNMPRIDIMDTEQQISEMLKSEPLVFFFPDANSNHE